jgi:osmotically-inducible protein OsmY
MTAKRCCALFGLGVLACDYSAPRREDSTLTELVNARFVDDPQFANVTVSATSGVVQLQGTVPNAFAGQRALEIARHGNGVRQVIDRLKLQR